MAILDDIKLIIPNSNDALSAIYIRKSITLISLYLNVPIVTIPDKHIFIPLEPVETIVFPDTPTTIKTDDGVTTTIQATNIETSYPDAIIEYVTLCYRKKGNEGLTQFVQGGRRGTYGSDLPQSVIALLPVPFVTMLGVRRC